MGTLEALAGGAEPGETVPVVESQKLVAQVCDANSGARSRAPISRLFVVRQQQTRIITSALSCGPFRLDIPEFDEKSCT